jgi:MFS family permease
MPLGAGRAGRPRLGVFRHRDFSLYWSGGLLSNTGTWLQNVTAAVHIYLLTQSAMMVGVLSAVTFLPILLFGLWGGVASDRFDRRRIVIVTHIVSMVAMAILTWLAIAGLVTPLILLVNAFVVNTAWAFAKPALVTLLPSLVEREELVEATASNSLQYTLAQFVGPMLSAGILAVANPSVAYGLNTLTFLGPILAMLLIRSWKLVPSSRSDEGKPWQALLAGLRYVRDQPVVGGMLLAVASSAALPEVVRTMSPIYAVEVLKSPEAAAGLLIGAQGFGAAIALFAMPALRRIGDSRLVVAGVAAQALGMLILAIAPGLEIANAGSFVAGCGFAIVFTHLTAHLLEVPSDTMRGRVMALHTVANLGLRPITAVLVGWGATVVDPRLVLVGFIVLAPLTLRSINRGQAHSARYHEELLRIAASRTEP